MIDEGGNASHCCSRNAWKPPIEITFRGAMFMTFGRIF